MNNLYVILVAQRLPLNAYKNEKDVHNYLIVDKFVCSLITFLVSQNVNFVTDVNSSFTYDRESYV